MLRRNRTSTLDDGTRVALIQRCAVSRLGGNSTCNQKLHARLFFTNFDNDVLILVLDGFKTALELRNQFLKFDLSIQKMQ